MALHVVKTHTMHLVSPPAAVFPLLCPVREYDWIESWACEVLYTRSGVAELDCVFQTRFPDDGPTDTWVVSRYEPPARIEFVRANALRAMRYEITLEPEGDGGTRSVWTQTITALNPEGEAQVRTLTQEAFSAEKTVLERMLNHYLTTGQRLPMSAAGR